MRTWQQRLDDIIAAVDRVRADEERLDGPDHRMAFDAVLYNLVVIGEAVAALPPPVRDRAPDVPWRDVVATRNFLAHQYFGVSGEVVRRTLDEPLEVLRHACVRLLAGG